MPGGQCIIGPYPLSQAESRPYLGLMSLRALVVIGLCRGVEWSVCHTWGMRIFFASKDSILPGVQLPRQAILPSVPRIQLPPSTLLPLSILFHVFLVPKEKLTPFRCSSETPLMVSSTIPFFPKSCDLQIASVLLTGKIPESRKYYLSALLRTAKEKGNK